MERPENCVRRRFSCPRAARNILIVPISRHFVAGPLVLV
jgi:hypothetical protein